MADNVLTLCDGCAQRIAEAYHVTQVLTPGLMQYDRKYECDHCHKKFGAYRIGQYTIWPKRRT